MKDLFPLSDYSYRKLPKISINGISIISHNSSNTVGRKVLSKDSYRHVTTYSGLFLRTDVDRSRTQLPFKTRAGQGGREAEGIPVTFPPTRRPQAVERGGEKRRRWHAREPF